MNKNQSIVSIISFVLIVFTLVNGNSQFQSYKTEKVCVNAPTHFTCAEYETKNIGYVQQRIEPKTIKLIILAEIIGDGFLFGLLKAEKKK